MRTGSFGRRYHHLRPCYSPDPHHTAAGCADVALYHVCVCVVYASETRALTGNTTGGRSTAQQHSASAAVPFRSPSRSVLARSLSCWYHTRRSRRVRYVVSSFINPVPIRQCSYFRVRYIGRRRALPWPPRFKRITIIHVEHIQNIPLNGCTGCHSQHQQQL